MMRVAFILFITSVFTLLICFAVGIQKMHDEPAFPVKTALAESQFCIGSQSDIQVAIFDSYSGKGPPDSGSATSLQTSINKCLNQTPNVEIVQVLQSANGSSRIVISIFYKQSIERSEPEQDDMSPNNIKRR